MIILKNTNRIDLLLHLKNFCSNTSSVEIGVWRGEFSKVINDTKLWNLNYGVDPYFLYEGYTDKPGKEFKKGQERLDQLFFDVNTMYNSRGMNLIRKMSTEAAKNFPDNDISFVYIDGNHRYEAVVEDINAWWPKTKDILAGDDYSPTNLIDDEPFGVIEAVNEFVEFYNLTLFLTNDRLPSWFVFKDITISSKFLSYLKENNL